MSKYENVIFAFQNLKMKRLLLAIVLLTAAFTIEAQVNINHYIRVGRTRISIGNYTGATEYFNIVIKFKPHLPDPYFFRGVAKHQLEDYRGAVLDYNKAIDIKPYYPDAYTNRGMAFYDLKEFEKAIEDYNMALELDPENEGVYNNRGIAKISLKDVEGAVADYNKALEINPNSTTALMNRSNSNIIKGDTREAIRDLNKVIIIRPHYAGAYLNRGLARFELENFAAALRDYDQCIKLDPRNALAYNNRGIVKHKLEDYNGAIMDYDMALALNPEQASAYFNRAMAKEILGRPGFNSDYSIAAQLNPQYDLSRYQVDSEQLAQNTRQNQQGQQQGQAQSPQNQNTTNQQNNTTSTNQASTQANNNDKKQEESPARRRRRVNLIVADNRNLPGEEEEKVDDGRVQNKNIIIDLQPLFLISAFEKNSVDYDRFQYYNSTVETMNEVNNYNPRLNISNKPITNYNEVFNNFILIFNERLDIIKNAHNYTNRGIFKSLTGNYNSALDDMDRAITMDSKNLLAYFSRGNCRYKMIEHIESLPDFTNQLTIALNNSMLNEPVNTEMSGMIRDYDLILRDYEKTLQLNPSFFFGYYNRAYINLRLKKYESAIEDLSKAIELEPEFAEAYYNRGLTKIFLDDVEGGAYDLSKAGELGLVTAYNVIKRYCN